MSSTWTGGNNAYTNVSSNSANWNTAYNNSLSSVIINPSSLTSNIIQPTSAIYVPLTIKAASGQTANLQEWENSSGTILSRIDSSGNYWNDGQAVTSASIINWNGAYSTVNTISANWNNVYNQVQSQSANWINNVDANSIVYSNSANWNNVYNQVQSQSANWINNVDADSIVYSNSANWNNVYNQVKNTSANWINNVDADSIVYSNSANWNNVYNQVKNVSSTWIDDIGVNSVVYSSSANWNTAYSNTLTLSTNLITLSAQTINSAATFIVDNGTSVITIGNKSRVKIPFNATITGWELTSDMLGSCNILVQKSTYLTYPTFVTISGTENPFLSSQMINKSISIASWTPNISAGDYLRIVVNGALLLTNINLNISMVKG